MNSVTSIGQASPQAATSEIQALFLRNVPGCVKLLDLDGNLIAMNEQGTRMMEIDYLPSILGCPWKSLWPADAQTGLSAAVAQACAGQRSQFSGFCPTAKGTPRWWKVDINPLFDERDQFDKLIAVSHDVTDLQEASQSLHEQNLRRELSLEVGEIGEWSLDIETGRTKCSARHDLCFGFSEPVENWSFEKFLGLVHPDERQQVKDDVEAAIHSHRSLHKEYRVIWPDGTVHWIASKGAVAASQGKPTRWLGVVQDITERKRAEAIALGQKQAFERVVAGASLDEILGCLCLAAEAHSGGIANTCILTVDDEHRTLRHAASPSMSEAFQKQVSDLPIGLHSSPCGESAFKRKPLHIPDTACSNLPDEFKQLAERNHIKSCWTTPILSAENQCLGTFSFYYRRDYQPNENDRQAVAALVNTAALILDRHWQALKKRAAETAYRDAQTRLSAILEAAEIATWTINIREQKLYGDVNLQRLLSLSPSEIEGGSVGCIYRSIHPDDEDRVRSVISQSMRSEHPYEMQFRVRATDSYYHTLLARGRTEYDSHCKPFRLLGVLLDITRQRLAETNLQISKERYARLFRIMDQGFCVIEVLYDQQGRATDCRYVETNPAFEEHSGLTNITGKTFKSVLPNIEQFWIDKYARVAETGQSCRFEHESAAMGRWFEVYASPITGSSNLVSLLFTDITARKHSERTILDFNLRLEREINYDTLTGLPNRRLFRDRLSQQIRRSNANKQRFYLLLLDLDRFKEVNDLLGHDAGDVLLKQVAIRIQQCVSPRDTVARLGGDEFVVILDENHILYAEQVAQLISQRIGSPFDMGSDQIQLTCSIGITACPDDATSAEDLIRYADQAMYLAKTGGRNQFSFFQHSMHLEAIERLKLIGDLRQALALKQIELYFQPICDLKSDQIVKAEVLVRWNHPSLGMVPPSRFIELAEETELIHEVGDWVFRETVKCLDRFRNQFGTQLQLSINCSPKQLLKKGLVDNWLHHTQELGLPTDRLVIEITEGVLISQTEAVIDNLQQLHKWGFKLSIDDFGTGYSSLAYLKKLHVDYLKIDQSFVRDVVDNVADGTIVETIILMGHKLGLKVIAEGVEGPHQKQWLRRKHCDHIQGYMVAKPLTLLAFEKLVELNMSSVSKH